MKKTKNPKITIPLFRKWQKLKKGWKIFSICLLLLLLVIVGLKIRGHYQKQKTITIAQVSKQTIDRKILRSGILEYKGITEVSSTTQGQVTKIFVKNGDSVEKDQVLFEVISTATPEEKAEAWSAYLTAKNALEEAKQGNNKTQAAVETAKQSLLTSEQEVKEINDHGYTDNEKEALKSAEQAARYTYEAAQSDTTLVENRIKAAQADLNVAWLKYQTTQDITMTAPLAGRIENLSIEEGDVVDPQNELANLMIISNPRQVIAVTIGEIDAALMTASLSAEISVDAFENRIFPAFVSKVDKVGKQNDDGGITYTAWLTLDDVYPELLSGMAADVEILIETKKNVLAVPNEALLYNNGHYQLVIGNQDKQLQAMKNVDIGIRNETYTEIKKGASEGETVLVGYRL
ncbi:biotin/lipoyl-binding protein [Candidatus Beckwithbacteria bacterium]|nr:biotin/lipoyl-binding protein [Candidatus Beckwithbacteria bacterium]